MSLTQAGPPAASNSNEGTMWRAGETFSAPEGGIWVTVESATPDGFEVTVAVGQWTGIFADGFESAGIGNWSTAVP